MPRRWSALVASLVTASALTGAGQLAAAAPAGKLAETGRWDVVLILTDDQPVGTMGAMPRVNQRLAGRGTTFSNAVVPTSLCCPSRTSLLTGMLATKTGVYNNDSATGSGGYPAVRAAGLERNTIATTLDSAGYRTAYFGKYLNQYGHLYDGVAPPGWDVWRAFTTKRSGAYYKYGVTNGVLHGQPPGPVKRQAVRKYSTTFFGREAARHIEAAPVDESLFTVFAPYAPHSPFKARKKYRGTSSTPGDYFTDAVNESDVSDKPEYVRSQPVRDLIEGQPPGVNLAKQMDSLRSVDDEFERIYQAVKSSGRLGRTLFIYMSDNGYLHGEHRLDGKGYPYARSVNVPLVTRWGKERSGAVDPRLTVANTDVSATVLQAAGLPNTTDGASLLGDRNELGVLLVGTESSTRAPRPPYCAWRTREELYVRYGTGEEEFYDYRTDPWELLNRVGDPGYAARIGQLRGLTRSACSPVPPGYGPDFDYPRWHPVRGGSPVPFPPDAETDKASRA